MKYVAQAVAVNEHRTLFPGESIYSSPSSASSSAGIRNEVGFIGAHADIGGRFLTTDSQLAQVALTWMVNQATAAGVSMNAPPDTIIANPVLHDKSNGTEDRDRCLRANNEVWANNCQKQKVATPGGMNWAQSAMFRYSYLNPQLDADGVSKITGYVNMQGYAKWLKQNYGFDIAYQ